MRVGGRLQQSQLSYSNKHQIILHPQAHLTRLIIEYEHIRLLHGGVQLTQCSLRQKYWIINDKSYIRSVIHKCITCFRFRASGSSQLLGQLPAPRVTPSKPFSQCAVDYAGPMLLRQGGQRSKSFTKAYISLFICLSTKAIHLELVSDLSADAFLAALKRFISRRGIPEQIFSDNGTNFRRAGTILHQLYKLFQRDEFQRAAQDFASPRGIKWSFIPPSAPHFGGLWESGVKSVKFHLRRVIGNTKSHRNFEEFSTVLTQVEACLNSRPLFSISNDAGDPEPLTPAHFLVGSPLTALPEPDYSGTNLGRLGR